MQQLEKLNLKISAILNELEKYMSFNVKLKKTDLVIQKRFYRYEYMTDFEKFKEKLPCKEKFYSPLTNRL